MKNKKEAIDPEGKVKFPIKATFDDGSTQTYRDRRELCCSLEDFDSTVDTHCKVHDSEGREVTVVVKLLDLKRLELKE